MAKQKELKAIDIELDEVKSKGIAYYRLDDDFYNFLKKVEEKENIIGFEYDGSRNFGIILGE